MPVEEDVNLDNPEGLTQDDIDILQRQADDLLELSESAEESAEKITKAKRSMEGMNFKQLDLLKEGPTEENLEGVGSANLSEIHAMVADLLMQMKEREDEAKKHHDEIEQAKKKIEENKRKIEMQHLAEEAKIRNALPSANARISQGFSFKKNPIQSLRMGGMGALRGLGPWGFVAAYAIEMVQSVANQVIEEIKSMYEPGGVLDVRKETLNSISQIANLKHLIDVEQGKVYFTSDTAEFLRQGIPQQGNTREKVNGHKQYLQEFDR